MPILKSIIKNVFLEKKVKYLGHVVLAQEITTDSERISAVENWPLPMTKKLVQNFLKFCSYYRKIVKNFSILALIQVSVQIYGGFMYHPSLSALRWTSRSSTSHNLGLFGQIYFWESGRFESVDFGFPYTYWYSDLLGIRLLRRNVPWARSPFVFRSSSTFQMMLAKKRTNTSWGHTWIVLISLEEIVFFFDHGTSRPDMIAVPHNWFSS